MTDENSRYKGKEFTEHHVRRGHVEVAKRTDKYKPKGKVYAPAWIYWHDCVSDAVLDGGNKGDMHLDFRQSRNIDEQARPWSGTKTYPEAEQLATEGWPKGRVEAEGLADVMEGKIGVRTEQAFVSTMAEFGARPSVPHYLAGDPECMIDYRLADVSKVGRVVRIYLDVGGSAGFKPNVFMARASAVLAMIETLNRQGDQVEVYAGHSLWPGGGKTNGALSLWFTKVHGAGEVLDPDALAFFCGHPAVLRRVSFALEENMPEQFRKDFNVGTTYGRSEDKQDRLEHLLEHYVVPHTGEFDIVLGSLNVGAKIKITDQSGTRYVDWSREGDRVDWIKTQLKDLGFELED